MKLITSILIVFVPFFSMAQDATIKFNNGDEPVDSRIQAIISTGLITTTGNYDYGVIEEIIFDERNDRFKSTYEKLSQHVIVSFFGEEKPEITSTIVTENVNMDEQSIEMRLEKVENNLTTFGEKRASAKILLILGGALLSYSGFVAAHNDRVYKDYSKDNTIVLDDELMSLSPVVPVIGAGMLTLGFVIDLSSGKVFLK